MAARNGIIEVDGLQTGTAAKTLLQLIAAANHAVEIIEIGCGFHGVNTLQEPILVQLVRQTTAGTMSAGSIVKADDSGGDTFDTTAQENATVEPTTTDILRQWTVHPQTSLIYQVHDKAPIIIGAGDRLGLRVTSANDVKTDCYMAFQE